MQAMERPPGWTYRYLVRGRRARVARILAIQLTLALTVLPLLSGATSAAEPGNEHFLNTWQRTDLPVSDLLVNRTWMWGPEANTDVLVEPYAESPGGEREVQYYDKSRMEITHPDGDPNSIWYVTNGLLVVELITGNMQIGDNSFEQRDPADVPVAGDLNDEDGPTYLTFGGLLDAPPANIGDVYTNRLSRSGQVASDPDLTAMGIAAAHVDEITGHAIAAPFWAFMNSTGLIHQDGQYVEDLLFESPVFATGRPITEAYWAEVLIAGTPTDVLMQCFERRCLTYNPANQAGWQVEAGNVGIHYYEWRYGAEQAPPQGDPDPGDPPPGDPPPGDPPPDDPPPGDPPPGDPPPGDPPPGEPPAGEVPAAPHDVHAQGYVGSIDGSYILLAFAFGDNGQVPIEAPAQAAPLQANGPDVGDPQPEGFRVYRQESSEFALYQELAPDQFNFQDFEVVHGGRYCYYVTAFKQAVESAPSDTVCAEVPYPPDAPQLISPLAGYDFPGREIDFKWGTVDGATGYVVCILKPEYVPSHCDFNLDPDAGYLLWVSGPHAAAGETTIDLPDALTPDGQLTELYWTVAACAGSAGDCGTVAEFRALSVDLTGPALAAPSLLTPADGYSTEDNYAQLTWAPVDGAASYRVCIAYEIGARCPGNQVNMSAHMDPSVTSYDLWFHERAFKEFEWSVAACDENGDCVWQEQYRSLIFDRLLDPPTLVSAVVDPNDPGSFTFSWNPVPGAERYIICVAEPGANCEHEVGDWYKSSILGPAVVTYPMDIPLWLVPDGQVTNLNWKVAACDANLNCSWGTGYSSIVVDRT